MEKNTLGIPKNNPNKDYLNIIMDQIHGPDKMVHLI